VTSLCAVVLVLGLGWAWPASADVRTLLQVPVNFQNDTSQPRPLAQLKANADAGIGQVLQHNSYGTMTLTSTVVNYLTLPMNKGCPRNRGILPVLDMTKFNLAVKQGLLDRGEAVLPAGRSLATTSLEVLTGYTYVYVVSPTTFYKCSHDNTYGLAVDSEISQAETLTVFAWTKLGLRMSVDWLCREAVGSTKYVTLSAFCGPSPSTANGRDMTTITGQGSSLSLTAADRNRLGWLPASHQLTVPGGTQRGQWRITYLENPAEGLKRLLLTDMGVEISYHAPLTSRNWDSRGVTGHLINSSYRIDFTPDNKWLFGSTALEPTASWVYRDLRLTVLSADLDAAVVDLRPASDPRPTIPAGPRCATTSPDPSLNVRTLVDGACGKWAILPDRRVYRDGWFFAGYADSLSFCNGTVYVPSGAFAQWNRFALGATGATMLAMYVPSTPPCAEASAAVMPPTPARYFPNATQSIIGARH